MTQRPNDKIVIISDTHMGRPDRDACTAQQLRPLWHGAAHFIVNGDVAEIQDPSMRSDAAKQIQDLQDLCDADGIKLTLLSGNHDAFLSDTRHLLLSDGRVLVTHGDVFHPAIAPWARGAKRMHWDTQRALSRFSSRQQRDIDVRLSASQHVSQSDFARQEPDEAPTGLMRMLTSPVSMGKVLHYWLTIPTEAARFAEGFAPTTEAVIFGHSHRQGIWRRRERLIINTGSFTFPGKPRAVAVQGLDISVWPIQRNREGYGLAARPIASFRLSAGSGTQQAA